MGTDLRDRDRQTWLRLYVCLLSLGLQPAHQLSECQLPWIRNRSMPTSWSPSSPPLTLPLSVLWEPALCRHSVRSTQWDLSNSLARKATPTTMDPMATRSLPLRPSIALSVQEALEASRVTTTQVTSVNQGGFNPNAFGSSG